MKMKGLLDKIKSKSCIIEIFGLGYVGFPLAVKLSFVGFKIIGIDVNAERISRLKNNELQDSEELLKEKFIECRKENLTLSEESKESKLAKIGIICVPTPIPDINISSDIYVRKAVKNFLNNAKEGDCLILESSVEVGTTESMQKLIEDKGFKIGVNFGLSFCPERIDPSNKEWGIENIPRIIYSSDDVTFEISKEIYNNVNGGNLIRVESPKVAEVVKSFENAFRLVNISLVNELAILCDNLGINVKSVIDAAATKPFGFMPHYPGAGAGGHCIPKDPRFLLESAKKFQTNFDTIENALSINVKMPKYISNSIENSIKKLGLKKSILVSGLSYKTNVEDMRDSASFKIINELITNGFEVFGYDPYFKKEVTKKYLIENNLKEMNFSRVDNLDEEVLKKISCICIVQHHDISRQRIDEIYQNSKIPLIYDCQNKIRKDPDSKTILNCLGN
ncbi:MAG: nucleotide sugar dehydrogenase [Nitrosopumilus sp.]|nr:nucleotide sugar dehydrogenase [Nitrosopumilus sp.]